MGDLSDQKAGNSILELITSTGIDLYPSLSTKPISSTIEIMPAESLFGSLGKVHSKKEREIKT